MASSPVRGIQEIQWKRKDQTVGTAYRVRITPILDDVHKIKRLSILKEKQQLKTISEEEKNELLNLLLELT